MGTWFDGAGAMSDPSLSDSRAAGCDFPAAVCDSGARAVCDSGGVMCDCVLCAADDEITTRNRIFPISAILVSLRK